MEVMVLPFLALVAGVVSFTSPCCLPLIPSYLSYVTALPVADLGSRQARAVTLRASLLFVAGFTVVFTGVYPRGLFDSNVAFLRYLANVGAYSFMTDIYPAFGTTPKPESPVSFDVAYPRPAFDEQSMHWDLNYFKYHFLKLAAVPFNEQRLEADFARLTSYLLQAPADTFLYRDFQSRNVMIKDGEPWFVDFQGGRKGAPHYDVASLLYDAKAAIPAPLREELLEHYLDELCKHMPVDRERFKEQFTGFVLVRLMQALGAYGYRGFFERKRRFLESVPHAARNLDQLLAAGLPLDLPELEQVFRRIVAAFSPSVRPSVGPSPLSVLIRSFSYRDGYPADTEGHGGGFVFDCRALPNPHHVPELQPLTGRDEPVADWLERHAPVQEFWAGVTALVDAHVEKFVDRAFSSLTVSFGCTGGRHRSVYFATKLAAHLVARFPHVAVRMVHGKI